MRSRHQSCQLTSNEPFRGASSEKDAPPLQSDRGCLRVTQQPYLPTLRNWARLHLIKASPLWVFFRNGRVDMSEGSMGRRTEYEVAAAILGPSSFIRM